MQFLKERQRSVCPAGWPTIPIEKDLVVVFLVWTITHSCCSRLLSNPLMPLPTIFIYFPIDKKIVALLLSNDKPSMGASKQKPHLGMFRLSNCSQARCGGHSGRRPVNVRT